MGSSSGGGVLHRLVEGGGKVEKSILRVLEVLEVVDGQQLIGWHYIHKAPGAFNPKLPLAQRRLLPEQRAHLRTQQRARLKRGTEDQYEKILGEYSFGEF